MFKTVRRALAAAAVTLSLCAGLLVTAPAAEAQAFPIDFDVTVTTFIAGLNQENTFDGGKLVGEVDLATGALVADLTLPPSETQLDLVGLPLATAGFQTDPTGPITGTVDLADLTAETRSEFDIRILYLRPTLLPFINLVGSNCKTSEPIVLESTGTIDLGGASQISGEFEIPNFERCGLVTPILNALIPGPGNTFTATLTQPPA